MHGRPTRASARSACTKHDCGSGCISLCNYAACTSSAADRILVCSLANAMCHARLFGGTLSAVCTGAGRTISAAHLSAAHGLASYFLLVSLSIVTLACSSTATPDKSRSVFAARAVLVYRSVKCFAHVRHYSLVQVNSGPARRLCRKAHLSNPFAQTSKARGELRPFPGQLRDFTSKEHRHSSALALLPSVVAADAIIVWRDQPEVVIQGKRDPFTHHHCLQS